MNNVIFTKISFYRNLKDYKFSNKLSNEQKQEIVNKLKDVFQGKLSFLDIENADENTLKYLLSNKMISKETNQILFNQKDQVCVDLFNSEHMTISASTIGYNKSVFEKAKKIVDILNKKISLSFNDDFGYLMSDIAKIGAGLKLECEISLPSIKSINKIEQVKQNVRKLGYQLTETSNQSVFKLSTICNLGFSEKEIILEFEKMVSKLQELELESLKVLDTSNHDDFVDKVQRSYAILNSAYLLGPDELNNLILNLRLGLNLNILNIDLNIVNKLQTLANLNNTQIISQTELKQLAENVKNILKGE